jgi:hypothetical protein
MFSVQDAVARFFPAGADYDRKEAERLISWLDSCGYAVVPKTPAAGEPSTKRAKKSSVRPPSQGSDIPYLRLVK